MKPQTDAVSAEELNGLSETAVGLAPTLKRLRANARLTLQDLSRRSGISVSALSKIENGQLSPTYERIVALARGLTVDVGELFGQTRKPTPLGRRSVTRRGAGVMHRTNQYLYEVLNADLADKRFVPLVTTIRAHSVKAFGSLLCHEGEEFIYVLEGTVVLHTDFYAPTTLEEGDSCFFDSMMGHACVSAGTHDAKLLWVCTNLTLDRSAGPLPQG